MSIYENLEKEQKKLEEMIDKTTGDLLEGSQEGIKMRLNGKYQIQKMAENLWDIYIGDIMEEELKNLVQENNMQNTASFYEIFDSLRNRFYQVFYEKVNAISNN